MAKTLRDDLQM